MLIRNQTSRFDMILRMLLAIIVVQAMWPICRHVNRLLLVVEIVVQAFVEGSTVFQEINGRVCNSVLNMSLTILNGW